MNAMTRSASKARIRLVPALLLVAACTQDSAQWTPVLETTSTSFLTAELGRTLEDLSAARGAAESDPALTIEHLDAAERRLSVVRETYLPLLDARERAYNVYRLHHLGRDGDAVSELEQIRLTVLEVSGTQSDPLVREMERLLELVADARIELESGSPSVATSLRALAVELDDFMNRAGLFLGDERTR